jgi:hypothetical protein
MQGLYFLIIASDNCIRASCPLWTVVHNRALSISLSLGPGTPIEVNASLHLTLTRTPPLAPEAGTAQRGM